jgi:hypothetical protein
LLSYYNQPDHRLVDRQLILPVLLAWADTTVEAGPGAVSREEQLRQLSNQAGSELERRFLRYLDERGLRLPTRAQVLFPDQGTRPDLVYDDDFLAVYVDGPPHDFPDRQTRDLAQIDALNGAGWSVERVRYDDDWAALVSKRPDVFGEGIS